MGRMDEMPQAVKAAVEAEGLRGEPEIVLRADMDPSGAYCDVWVIAGRQELLVLVGERAESPAASGRPRMLLPLRRPAAPGEWRPAQVQRFALDAIESFETEGGVGAGMLTASVGGEARLLCRYSNTHARKFNIAVKALNKLKRGEPLTEADFADDHPADSCPKCGRLYPPGRRYCLHCMDRRALTLRVLSFFRGHELEISLILLFMVAGSVLSLLGPYMNGRILFDEVLTPGGRYEGRLVEVVVLMALFQLLSIGFSIAHARINAKMTAQVIAQVKSRVFEAMSRLSLGFFTNKQTGSLMVRVNSDSHNLQYFFHDGFPYFVVNLLQIAGVVGVMLYMNWRLALMVLVPVPVMIVLMRQAFPKLWRLFTRRWRSQSGLASVVNDALTGVRVVKAFGKERQEIERFGRKNREVYLNTLRTGYFTSILFPAMGLLIHAGGLVVWGAGGWDVMNGRISFGTLMAFSMYLGMLYGPLEFMTHVVDWWTSCINSANRIFEVLDAVPEVAEKPNPVRLRPIRGDVELEGVTFSYEPNKPVLKNINLSVKAGEMIGLVGHSGAGKSTITNLICRLYDVNEGCIRIDGVDIRDVAIADLRSQIGVVPQETYLFKGTVAENIAYAKPGASADEIIRAAKIANAHEFIVELPDGYETVIGAGGHDLSGGQKQRLSIARAILQNPRILILDEATASVDTETEQKIQQALERLVAGRTTFAIAHRLSTLRNADRLVVIEKGEIVEIGTHDELERKQGVYYRLRQKQQEALAIRGVAAG